MSATIVSANAALISYVLADPDHMDDHYIYYFNSLTACSLMYTNYQPALQITQLEMVEEENVCYLRPVGTFYRSHVFMELASAYSTWLANTAENSLLEGKL